MSALLERLGGAFLTVLGWFKNPELIKPEFVEVATLPEVDEEKSSFPKTLNELLDNLDETFNSYKFKYASGYSWIDRDTALGLKKLGAHVPNPWLFNNDRSEESLKVDVSKGMPSMLFISNGDASRHVREGYCSPDFMFAIKGKKLPWNVEKKSGTPYQFGMAYRDEAHIWLCAWFVVKPDGKLEICKQHTVEPVRITKGQHKNNTYYKKVYKDSNLLEWEIKEMDDRHLQAKVLFRECFNWWISRNDRWSVSVKKNGERVTFSVEKSLTKKYFEQRDKTVITKTGQKKKILHYVREHERNYGGKITVVKEHIRGLNKFTWKGYECLISAPEFGMKLVTSDFDVSSVQVDDDMEAEEFVSASKVGLMLARNEERMAAR